MTNQEHFAIIDISYHPLSCWEGLKVIATTDAPCHLYLRWTRQEPLVHQEPYLRRGVAIGTVPRFCVDLYQDNSQEEPLDTLIHTFLKPSWLSGETRWFYFFGTVACELSPSESCIFEYQNIHPSWQEFVNEKWNA